MIDVYWLQSVDVSRVVEANCIDVSPVVHVDHCLLMEVKSKLKQFAIAPFIFSFVSQHGGPNYGDSATTHCGA